jgi:hydrogenase maturation protease
MTYMRRTLIIGCGNSLRQDDGVGYVTAQQLATTESKNNVRVIACQQLTPDLAMEMNHTDRVILIDATVDGPPGCISVQKIEPLDQNGSAITHELQPSTLLEYARVLYGSSPQTYLVSVTGVAFDFGGEFSGAVQAALPELHRCVRQLVNG